MSRRKHPAPAHAPRALGHDERMRRRTMALSAYVQADATHRMAQARYHRAIVTLASSRNTLPRLVLVSRLDTDQRASAMAFHAAATRLHRQEHPIAREDEARAVRAPKQAAATAQALLDASPRAPRQS